MSKKHISYLLSYLLMYKIIYEIYISDLLYKKKKNKY